MKFVKRRNKVLKIDDRSLKSYLAQGYDEITEDGKVLTLATGGRSVSVGELNAALTEIEKLKLEIASLKEEAKEEVKEEKTKKSSK